MNRRFLLEEGSGRQGWWRVAAMKRRNGREMLRTRIRHQTPTLIALAVCTFLSRFANGQTTAKKRSIPMHTRKKMPPYMLMYLRVKVRRQKLQSVRVD
ncbi:UNVERIFIED_CONTAM: hypothetical protein FKN15_073127 [Acipenser sinensis]